MKSRMGSSNPKPPPAEGAGAAAHQMKVATRFMPDLHPLLAPRPAHAGFGHRRTKPFRPAPKENLYRNLSAGMVPGASIVTTPDSGRRVRLRSSGTHRFLHRRRPQLPATACFLFDTARLPAPKRARNGSTRLVPPRVAKRMPEIDKKCASGPVSRSRMRGSKGAKHLNPLTCSPSMNESPMLYPSRERSLAPYFPASAAAASSPLSSTRAADPGAMS